MSTLQIHHLASRASQVWADGVRAPRPNRATTSPASDVTHYEYGPFGELIRATGPMAKLNPFRFSTKYQDDETDLVYYGYRYYNASTGRWLSRDPIEEQGGLNLYGFVGNNPIMKLDVLGLDHNIITAPVTSPAPMPPGSNFQFPPGEKVVTVPVPDPNDTDNGFVPANFNSVINNASTSGYLYITVPSPGDPSMLNKRLKSVCGCIENLTITGHGAGGMQNIGPSQSTGAGTIQLSYSHGQTKVNNIGVFEGVKFCSSCTILLDGCSTATGIDWQVLFNAIQQKTGCKVLGNTTPVYPGRRGPLPGP